MWNSQIPFTSYFSQQEVLTLFGYIRLSSPFFKKHQNKITIFKLLFACQLNYFQIISNCCIFFMFNHVLLWFLSEFIHLVSSEANEVCKQRAKKTIAPEHIIDALKVTIKHYLSCHLPTDINLM